MGPPGTPLPDWLAAFGPLPHGARVSGGGLGEGSGCCGRLRAFGPFASQVAEFDSFLYEFFFDSKLANKKAAFERFSPDQIAAWASLYGWNFFFRHGVAEVKPFRSVF